MLYWSALYFFRFESFIVCNHKLFESCQGVPTSQPSCDSRNLSDGPVRTPAADEEQASEAVQGLVVVVWEHLLLRGVPIEPCFPLFLMVAYLKETKNKQF